MVKTENLGESERQGTHDEGYGLHGDKGERQSIHDEASMRAKGYEHALNMC